MAMRGESRRRTRQGGPKEKKEKEAVEAGEGQHGHKRDGHRQVRQERLAKLPSPSKVAGSFERGELLDAPIDSAKDKKWQFLFGSDVIDSFPHPTTARRRFNEDGYITLDSFLSKEGIRYLQDRIGDILAHKVSSVHSEWIMSPHQFLAPEENWVWPIATHPLIASFLAQHLGDSLVLFSTQIAMKPPHGGTSVPWHQDGENCCTVWIPLDRVDARNGTLQVQPGLHKNGLMPFRRFTEDETREEIENAYFFMEHHLFEVDAGEARKAFARNKKSIVLPAGGLEIHQSCTPHASLPNTSARPRRVLILRYQAVTEPVVGGPVVHWKTGETREKLNYLIRVNPKDETEAAAREAELDDGTINSGAPTAKRSKRSGN